jgi:DNA-binding PadR family transcriptional regulator
MGSRDATARSSQLTAQRPERTRYAITEAGRRHLEDLLRRGGRELRSPAEPIQLALAARPELDEEEVQALLGERAEALRARLRQLHELARSAPAPEMVDRQRALTKAELKWTGALLTESASPNREQTV